MFFPSYKRSSFTPIQSNRQNYGSACVNLPTRPRPMFFPSYKRSSFTPIQSNRQNYGSACVNLPILGWQVGRRNSPVRMAVAILRFIPHPSPFIVLRTSYCLTVKSAKHQWSSFILLLSTLPAHYHWFNHASVLILCIFHGIFIRKYVLRGVSFNYCHFQLNSALAKANFIYMKC